MIMNRKTFILIVFFLAITVTGQDDPNCILYEPQTPPWDDPNGFGNGIMLPGQYDPNGVIDYNVPCGKFVRVGTYCDRQNDFVVFEPNTPGWGITTDKAAGTWTLSGEVFPGPNYVQVRVQDVPLYNDPVLRIYAVWIWGVLPENDGPVLR